MMRGGGHAIDIQTPPPPPSHRSQDFRGRARRASKKNFQLVAVPPAVVQAGGLGGSLLGGGGGADPLELERYTTGPGAVPVLLFGKARLIMGGARGGGCGGPGTVGHPKRPPLQVSKDRFSLDYGAPLGPVQALAIALTTFASKMAVA